MKEAGTIENGRGASLVRVCIIISENFHVHLQYSNRNAGVTSIDPNHTASQNYIWVYIVYCRISLVIRQSFSFQTNPKDLDLSYKTDLDLCDCLGSVYLYHSNISKD